MWICLQECSPACGSTNNFATFCCLELVKGSVTCCLQLLVCYTSDWHYSPTTLVHNATIPNGTNLAAPAAVNLELKRDDCKIDAASD